jgi:hypothetical protein
VQLIKRECRPEAEVILSLLTLHNHLSRQLSYDIAEFQCRSSKSLGWQHACMLLYSCTVNIPHNFTKSLVTTP